MKPAFSLLLCVIFLLGSSMPAAAVPHPAGSEQEVMLHLPFVQRGVPPHPQAALLRRVAEQGYLAIGADCGWEAGVLATGFGRMWEATGDEQYLAWLKSWLDGCLQRGAVIAHVNDLPLAYAAAVVGAGEPKPHYQALVDAGVEHVFTQAPRTADGTLIHLADMVWDDTVIVVIPFLLRMWRNTGEIRYLDEAVAQVDKHAQHLQDPVTGFYRHAWSEPANVYTGPFFWGRGNGWVVLSQAEVLAALPAGAARRDALLAKFTRQAAALAARQAPNGMWHTVVTREDFYQETSATALIAAGLATAAAQGFAGSAAAQAAVTGADATWRQVAAGGIVGGVSGPTGPMDQEVAYNTIPIEPFNLYGQGVVLWLGAATMPVS